MVTVTSKELFDFLKKQTKAVETLSNKELVLATFASQHLQGHYEFYIGAGTAAAGAGIVISFFALNPAFAAGVITAGCLGAMSTCYNLIQTNKIKKVLDIFTTELVKRYPNIMEAYIEISTMIQKIEREEIIEYFNRANNN